MVNFNNSKTGILLLSHGSRLPQGKEVIESYVEMFKNEYPDIIVDYAFMEIRQPNIPQTINKLTTENEIEKLIVVPVFIAHGLHTKRDIPKILGIQEENFNIDDLNHHHEHHHHHDHNETQSINFDGEIIFTDPLGIDSRIYEIIKDRVFDNL